MVVAHKKVRLTNHDTKLTVFWVFRNSIIMSTVIRRFISYVGKVKLSDFKDPTHMALVEKYCNEQESRVSYGPLYSTELI